ncbi:XRE family transcriptional regulator [Actinomyces wuliandei]|uniref:XRE family transcriptional regulator n=1 Tax=Actinomyces wuliandei TaxID=2057743 RepID=UPI0013E378E3|nr:XRE family transcriptional regulator [Actinomyces wuliandei]
MWVHPCRVRLARQRAGLTKTELARRTGVSTRTVTTWESEGAPPSRAEGLAAATRVPVTLLHRHPVEEVAEEAVFFRARRRSPARLRHVATALGALGTDFYAEVTQHFRLPALDLPEGAALAAPTVPPALAVQPVLPALVVSSPPPAPPASAVPQDAARELRTVWGLGELPAPNLVQLAEAHGVRVLGLPRAQRDMDAFSFWGADGYPYIFLARHKTAERSRFDLAHEIGHLVLHSEVTRTDERTDRVVEAEAHAFAGELLLPRAAVRAALGRSPSLQAVLELKERFGASAVAAARAAWDAGCLSEWEYRQMSAQLASRGFSTGEPGSRLGYEQSRVYRTVLDWLRQRGQPVPQWARSIGQHPDDVAAFMLSQALSAVPG